MGCSKKKLLVCSKGKSCPKLDSSDVFSRLKKAIATCGLEDYLKVKKVDCLGYCKHGPIVKVVPDGAVYGRLNDEDVIRIALRHAKRKKPVKSLLIGKKKR